MLRELALRDRDDLPVMIEQDGTRARRALIESQYPATH
jgi:hypothetical protein